MKIPILTLVATMMITAVPAAANDSSAAIGLGGLELTKNDAVSMDSEDLFISEKKVTVKYRFTNTSNKDVETLVSFPLPAIPGDIEGYLGDQAYPDWTGFKFETLVSGKPVKYDKIVKVQANGKDVSARLKALGWQVEYWDYDNEAANAKWFDLIQTEKQAYVNEGLLKWQGDDKKYVNANWQVQTFITRKQIFPAGKTIFVEHSYEPLAGGSVGGMMLKRYREEKDSNFANYAKSFCIDKGLLAGFDAKMAQQDRFLKAIGDGGGSGMYNEIWLSYILKSGANWKGPIKDFRLVVDKGSAKNMVSFCMNGVKKISSTQFEVRKTNFEPQKDLEILIINIPDPKDL